MAKATGVDPGIQEYIDLHCTADDPLLDALREQTRREFASAAAMQISPVQGRLLRMLTALSGARQAVEVGSFTGMSALQIARGLPQEGRLLCCDRSEKWTALALEYWRRAGVAERIDLRLAPALETLRALPSGEWIDFAFIDADKREYVQYYEELLKRTRPGGLIAIDNALWGGAVLDPEDASEDTRALREMNDLIARDERVECVLLPVADGLMLARKHA